MSTYKEYSWSVIDTTAVCALQNIASAGALVLNGTLVNSDLPNQVSFIANDMIRSVSITSLNNLSAINFTISGFQNEAFVTETIAGPNNNTIFSTKYYDAVISIITSGAANGITVGTGSTGYLPVIPVNTVSNNINYSCSVLLSTGAGITYSLLQTLDEITSNYISFEQQSSKLFPALGLTGETTSQIGSSTSITNYLLLHISASSTPTTDSLKFIFLQQ